MTAYYLNKIKITDVDAVRQLVAVCTQPSMGEVQTAPVQLFNYQVINLVHKTLFTPHTLPPIFQQYFSLNKSLHNYNTRNQRLQLS